MTYPLMMVLAYALLALAFIIPFAEFVSAWRARPLVVYDPRYGRWRAARLVRKENLGRK